MQVCTLLKTDNHTSTPPLSFLQAGCPSCRPTNSVKALKANFHNFHVHELLGHNYSMVFVTESWLKNSTVDGHLDNTDQYCIYRKDRCYCLAGGVLALISKSYCL